MRKRPPDSTPISPYRAAQERLTEEMWRLNRTRLLRGEAQVDPFLDRMEEDQRRCLTLLARIPPTLHPALLDVQARLLRAGPAFAYPAASFHFTIRGIYDYGKYTRVDDDIRAIGEILSRLIADLPPLAVHFRGVNCNRSAVFVQGFHDAPTLGMFRLAIGEALAAFRDVEGGTAEIHELELSEIDKFCLPDSTVRFRTFKIGSG
ncbi:MAG: hypothetical protein HY766_00035 [candidate division NC10 bacterium]|nr:hypothetical protein [candidate division NC10 bacterium]